MADESRGSFSSEITSPTDLSISSTKASLVAEAPSDASNVQSHTERIQSSQAAEVSKDEMEGNEGKDNGVNTMRTGKRKTCEIADEEMPSLKKVLKQINYGIQKKLDEIIHSNKNLELQIKKLNKKQVLQDKKRDELDERVEILEKRSVLLEKRVDIAEKKIDLVDKKVEFMFSQLDLKLFLLSK
ncbi:hypothetical protein BsWGS_21428 [Bradybaena similaris]